jgi:hypothetical protein
MYASEWLKVNIREKSYMKRWIGTVESPSAREIEHGIVLISPTWNSWNKPLIIVH